MDIILKLTTLEILFWVLFTRRGDIFALHFWYVQCDYLCDLNLQFISAEASHKMRIRTPYILFAL